MQALRTALARLVTRPLRRPARTRAAEGGAGRAGGAEGYPGDFEGVPDLSYSPEPDGRPDPGEIVWSWVPFEEDHGRGKDRPVLLVGHDGPWLLGLMLTSKDHDLDPAEVARHRRHWVDIGTGPWDRRGRPSEVRVDRVIRIDPHAIRREGSVLDEERFVQVAAKLRSIH